MTKPLALRLLAPTFAVCTLPSDAALPDIEAEFFSITRTANELSLVVPEADIPRDAIAESGWRGLQVQGPLPFDMIGVLANLSAPLARAGISIFALSTYQTDILFVRQDDLDRAQSTLAAAGHPTVP